ncbi:hypothetical protein PQR39_35225 [Paraburkholderia sediminicola]|uniref:hypothetical protein n=1 Tax=Paraburkholderia sediminicola TaxID=458836 RepID=UPI0038B78DC4
MNEVKRGNVSLTITDPETGERHTIGREEVRDMVSDSLRKPEILEVGAAPTQAVARQQGLQALNRKQRRAEEKKRRSKVFRKAEAKRIDGIRKQMQEQLDAQRKAKEEAEALLDIPFADPRNIGKISTGFAPVLKALDGLQDGVVACTPDGTPLYFEAEDGVYYPAVDCLRAVVETFAKLGHVHGWSNHNAGLTHLANLLEKDEPIHKKDVDAARKTIEWMKYCMLTITPRQFAAEVVEVQIKAEARAQGIAE